MVLTVNSTELGHAVGLTQSASDGFDEAQPAGEFAQQQNASRWTANTEAFAFARAYRDRLLTMQEEMDRITGLVEQFRQGLVDSGAEVEEVDDAVASYLELAGSEVDGVGHQPSNTTVE